VFDKGKFDYVEVKELLQYLAESSYPVWENGVFGITPDDQNLWLPEPI
jgi:hypothetical protein